MACFRCAQSQEMLDEDPIGKRSRHDRALLRAGFRHILEELGEGLSVFEACDLGSALRIADEHPDLDLALLSLTSSSDTGMRMLAGLHGRHPGLHVVLVSSHALPDEAMSALAHGAKGYVTDTVSAQVFLQAVRLVMTGGVYIPSELLAARGFGIPGRGTHSLDAALPDAARLLQAGLLTPRQTQVLELMAQGKSNKAIGRELRLAPGTVKTHVACVFRALGVRNRTQAALSVGLAVSAQRRPNHHAPPASHVN